MSVHGLIGFAVTLLRILGVFVLVFSTVLLAAYYVIFCLLVRCFRLLPELGCGGCAHHFGINGLSPSFTVDVILFHVVGVFSSW